MHINVEHPLNNIGTNVITLEIEDFRFGDDVDAFCDRLEVALNELMTDKRKKK